MHRGSSKAARGTPRAAEALPLSASPAAPPVRLLLTISAQREPKELWVAPGTTLRRALVEAGLPPEGSVALEDGVSVPLDLPIDRPRTIAVLSAFSGG